MTVEAEGFYFEYTGAADAAARANAAAFAEIAFASGRWKNGGKSSANLGTKSNNHAERALYSSMSRLAGSKTIYLIVQNAFPCYECLAYFKGLKDAHVVFVVTNDEGQYSKDVGIKENPLLPSVLYFHAGELKAPNYVAQTSALTAASTAPSDKGKGKRKVGSAAPVSSSPPKAALVRAQTQVPFVNRTGGMNYQPADWPSFPSLGDHVPV